ncbi:GNAT family N-acetyltransferase [Anseongella ginsenosidimutans]|uniref:GNAT family N-acetyltransferase n=1 Tax=Anseongella ginsenosidimutans TaxID=496056 RepID=UPI001CEF9D9D
MYVLPETQGKGTGRFLINTVELKAKEQGCQVLELNVNRFNKARSFYEKLGFKVQRTEDIPIGPFFMNDYIMQKIL